MCRKAEDADGLAPVKEDNTAARKIGRQGSSFFKFVDDYNTMWPATPPQRNIALAGGF